MKTIFSLLFFFSFVVCYAQVQISGEVIGENNIPLEGASIYLDNTTYGTTSDDEGKFTLKFRKGNYNLIVSYIGHQTISIQITIKDKLDYLTINLIPEVNVLDEVILKKIVYDKNWDRNFELFKTAFLGRTKLSKECKILNPKVLYFERSKDSATFIAEARSPLIIRHKGLGYLITYDMIKFSIKKGYRLEYLGYSNYKNLKGGRNKQKRWKKNRLKAFLGSRMHFVRSLRNKTLNEEGFVVHQFKRFINTERPSDKEITEASNLLREKRIISFGIKIHNPTNAIDSAIVVLQKSKLSKFEDVVYKKDIPYKDLLTTSEGYILLRFLDFLSITYLNEAPEENYYSRDGSSRHAQTSTMTMLSKYAILDASGKIINPLDVFYEGYWGFEQFADNLPVDYIPENK